MSSQQIDRLFRSKLDNYQAKPPVDAWNSIEQQLGKSNARKFPMYKIAASFLLVAITGFIAYTLIGNEEQPQLADTTEQITPKNIDQTPVASGNQVVEAEKNQPRQLAQAKESVETAERKSITGNLSLLEPISIEKKSISAALPVELPRVNYSEAIVAIPPMQDESLPAVTISFRSGKMLNDDATSEPVKESTLRKAWDYALSVKNGEERPFNIKEMKNELFASNLNKKRSKSQD